MIDKDFNLFREYLNKKPNDSLLELEKRERDSGFPIMEKGVQELIRLLMVSQNPEYVLELGTGVGFSSIFMCEYGRGLKEITTIELKEKNIVRAKKNIEEFGYKDKIKIIEGDATKVLISKEGLRNQYDLVFVDFAKAQYGGLWEKIRDFVKPGGVVISDDVLQKGSVIKSRFLLNRRDRTIHKRMREYLKAQMNDEEFTGGVFEIDDGITILTRNTNE